MADAEFARRIRERYPEGLTGLFAIGATRRTFILDRNRHNENPGHIADFSEQGAYLQQQYFRFISTFFDLGGQNMLIAALSFRSFFERGGEYAELVSQEVLRLLNDDACEYYKRAGIDPYFVGIDTLTLLPPESPAHATALRMIEFQKKWSYAEGRRKLIWEIASIPLYTFWQAYEGLSAEERQALEGEVESAVGLNEIYNRLYGRFSQMAYGTQIPIPHLYLGTNMSGDLKFRTPMPLALTGGDYLRMFYVPYPPLFMSEDAMKTMLNDLAFGDRFHSLKTDYNGRYTPELAEAEYQRIQQLSADPGAILGLSRRVRMDA
jgi:hypothetical protein